MYPEFLTVEGQELVANPKNKSFEDLCITPISFGHKSHELAEEITFLYGSHDVTKRDTFNN